MAIVAASSAGSEAPLFLWRPAESRSPGSAPRPCVQPVSAAAPPRHPGRHATISAPACRARGTRRATPPAGVLRPQARATADPALAAQQTQHRIHLLVRRPAGLAAVISAGPGRSSLSFMTVIVVTCQSGDQHNRERWNRRLWPPSSPQLRISDGCVGKVLVCYQSPVGWTSRSSRDP